MTGENGETDNGRDRRTDGNYRSDDRAAGARLLHEGPPGRGACAHLRCPDSGLGPHLEQMFVFWSSVALMSGRYHGSPMAKHMPLPIDAGHFDRWLALFEDSRAKFARPRPQRISSSGHGGSPKASSLALPGSTACCSTGERFRRSEAGAVQ